MSQHTPGPFKTVRIGERLYIEGAGPEPFLCDMQYEEALGSDRARVEADADFIVRACNSHDALRIALWRALAQMKYFRDAAVSASVDDIWDDIITDGEAAINRAEQGG